MKESERLGLGRVDSDDLVETACREDLPDLIGQGAECELGVPVAEGLCGQEDGAKTGAADRQVPEQVIVVAYEMHRRDFDGAEVEAESGAQSHGLKLGLAPGCRAADGTTPAE